MPRPRNSRPIYRLRKARNGVYQLTWTDPESGRTRSRSTGSRDEASAQGWLEEYLAALRKPDLGPGAMVAAVLDAYAAAREGNVADHDRILETIVPLKKAMGWVRLEDFTPTHARRYAKKRKTAPRRLRNGKVVPGGKPVAVATIRRELTTLRAAFRDAEHEKVITKAPFVPLPPKPAPSERWLTRHEAARLLWAARRSPHLSLFLRVGLWTTARPGHVLDLRWSQVDFRRDQIDFNEPGRAQTKKRRAVLPIPRRLRRALLHHRAAAQSPYVVEHNGKGIASIKKSFEKAARRAGLDDITPMVLRHTRATWMAQVKVPLDEIGRILGHTDPRTTHQTYAKWQPEHLRNAIDA